MSNPLRVVARLMGAQCGSRYANANVEDLCLLVHAMLQLSIVEIRVLHEIMRYAFGLAVFEWLCIKLQGCKFALSMSLCSTLLSFLRVILNLATKKN